MEKKIVFLILLMLSLATFGQTPSFDDTWNKLDSLTASMPEEARAATFSVLEDYFLDAADSLRNEGMYSSASEILAQLETKWKKVTGKDLSARFYVSLAQIHLELEDWNDAVETVDRYLKIYESQPDSFDKLEDGAYLKIFYNIKGMSLKNLEEWRKAIATYENANHYYAKSNDLGSQGGCLCNMAYCYTKLEKNNIARDLYEKGFQKYLDYFGTTRTALLKTNLKVEDKMKKLSLDVFSENLIEMAVFEQDNGNRNAMKDYLLMSVHCGNQLAKKEYDRIFGN